MSEPSDYEVGQTVYVHAFGHWYEGEVKKIGRKKVHVEYTSGTGKTRVKACSMEQISTEKLEGERAGHGRRRSERNKRERERFGPVMVQRNVDLSGTNGIRLMCAFQVLEMPSGFWRGTTHGRAREIIEEVTGIRLKATAHPERGSCFDLEAYIEWASNPDLQKEVDGDGEAHIVHVVKPGEEKGLPPGTYFMVENTPEPDERGMGIS